MLDFLFGEVTTKIKRTIETTHRDKRGLIFTTYIFIDGVLESKTELVLS